MATTKKKTGSTPPPPPPAEESVHDDFYRNLRAKITAWADRRDLDASYRDYILLVPDLFHFLTMLVMEPRVAVRDKAWLGVAVAYVLSPIDFIPDALFPIGLLDDLVVMVIVLDSILGNIPRSMVNKHWAGSQDLFTVVRESLQKADEWVGKGMFRRLKSYLAKQGLWKEAAPADVAAPPPVPAAPASPARKKTPSRRPAQRSAKKTTTATKKTAAKKTSTRKSAGPGGKKTTAKRTVSAKKRTTKKTTSAKRTIAAKKKGDTNS